MLYLCLLLNISIVEMENLGISFLLTNFHRLVTRLQTFAANRLGRMVKVYNEEKKRGRDNNLRFLNKIGFCVFHTVERKDVR